MSDVEPAYGNPQPPYNFPMPRKFENTPFEELPEGLKHRVRMLTEAQSPSTGGSTTGTTVDPAIAPPDTAGTV